MSGQPRRACDELPPGPGGGDRERPGAGCDNVPVASTDYLLEVLAHEGKLLGEAARLAGPAAEVPSCPGWRVGDLVRHLGGTHRWATGFVAGGLRQFVPPQEHTVSDEELADWFAAGLDGLLAALKAAPADLECWTVLPSTASGRDFWIRRQAHETAIHRIDAQAAAGQEITRVDAEFAEDGIDELLVGFHGRPKSRVRRERPGVLRFRASDRPGAAWTLAVSAEAPRAARAPQDANGPAAGEGLGEADCEISGPAAELYPALWNRPHDRTRIEVRGERELAELWATASAV